MEWMCVSGNIGSATEGDTAEDAAALFVCTFAAELPATPTDVVVSPYVGAPPGGPRTITVPLKVIFLGFDGVLNGVDTDDPMSEIIDGLFLSRHLVARLNDVIGRTCASVVLSTSWRYASDIATCASALRRLDFTGTVIGATPDFRSGGPYADRRAYTPRSDEIRAWLKANPADAFVVLDDHDDCEVDGHTIRTDARRGLSDENVERAVRILGGR